MDNMEMVISQPTGELPVVKFNKEEIKAEISKRMQYYSNITVTEESMKDSKKDLAELRKFKDNFETKRKELKKKFLKPYEDFEKEYKEIIELIDQPLNLISIQLEKLEIEQKQVKKDKIKRYYEKEAKDILDLVPFEKIFKEKWLNKTTSSKSICEEIATIIKDFKTGYDTIKNLNQKYEKQIIDKFIQTLDLQVALAEGKRLCEQDKKVNVIEQTYQQEKKEQQDTENKIQDLNKKYGGKQEEVVPTGPEEPKPQKYIIKLAFCATAEQLKMLRQFIADNNIEYKKI
jgi:hypothetical protein